jgi:gliding-associated putative ABC transporter substrate-binding component GldG
MDLRRKLRLHSIAQMLLVVLVVALANLWASRTFFRLDLTEDKVYSLDLATRALMNRVDRPVTARVYFTRGLQAPYNNHEQVVVDTLEDLRAYSKGLLEIQVTDPTHYKELEEEARRFGIEPIQYRYQNANVSEMKKVYMGLALVYGDRQEVLPAITQTESLEYDLARAIRALVSTEEKKTIGWSTGFGEPDLMTGEGPLAIIRSKLVEDHQLQAVALGGAGMIPEEVDALFVVGPQRPLTDRALYQLDQFVMRGGALALFVTNTRPDMRSLRPQGVYHNLDALIGHFGVQVNRDVVVDRTRNGKMPFPVRQGKNVVRMQVNYPLIPVATKLDPASPVVKGLDSMMFPFASSLTLADPLPPDVQATVLAASTESSGRIKGIRTVDPTAYELVAPGEERGSFPLLVSLSGVWPSYYANKEAPRGPPDPAIPPDDPAARLRESAPARVVISGSADYVANNVAFMLNLADWMVQEEALIGIRSKSVKVPTLSPLEPQQLTAVKLINLLGGAGLLLIFSGIRAWLRRPARRAS